ncbi:MAG: RHS repeat-associated core domain-containing protein [Albidovulum sp.]
MAGRPVAVVEGGQIYFIRTDHIGRPVFATNDLGVKVWEASYLPFGGVHVATGGIDLRFPGQWFQTESGLHQNWMRDYDPTTGRYIEPDPLGLVDGASVYGYVRQSPMMRVDPRGEKDKSNTYRAGTVQNNSSSPVYIYNTDTRTRYTLPPGATSPENDDWDFISLDGCTCIKVTRYAEVYDRRKYFAYGHKTPEVRAWAAVPWNSERFFIWVLHPFDWEVDFKWNCRYEHAFEE